MRRFPALNAKMKRGKRSGTTGGILALLHLLRRKTHVPILGTCGGLTEMTNNRTKRETRAESAKTANSQRSKQNSGATKTHPRKRNLLPSDATLMSPFWGHAAFPCAQCQDEARQTLRDNRGDSRPSTSPASQNSCPHCGDMSVATVAEIKYGVSGGYCSFDLPASCAFGLSVPLALDHCVNSGRSSHVPKMGTCVTSRETEDSAWARA